MKFAGYILFIALVLISIGAHAQLKITVVDSLSAPDSLSVTAASFGDGEVLTWKAPVKMPIPAYWYVITRVRKATNGVFSDSTVLNRVPGWDTTYVDNDAVLHCFTYTYYVSIEAKIDSTIVESPLSTGVQAREGGARNAVVIYPISKTLVAVAGSLFYDTVYACSSSDNPLKYSIIGFQPKGLTLDSTTGIITWNVPVDYVRGPTFLKVLARDSVDSAAHTTIAIMVRGAYLGSIDGNLAINDTTKSVTLFLVNIYTADVDTLVMHDASGYDFTGFSFKNTESGFYKVFVRPQPSPGVKPFWYHGKYSHNVADTIHVSTDVATILDWINVNFSQRAQVTLNGTLSDIQGPVSDGLIQAIDVSDYFTDQSVTRGSVFPYPPTLYYAASAATGSGGAFSIQVDSGVSYILLASAPGHQSQFIGPSGTLQTVSPFTAPVITPTGSNTEASYNGSLSNTDTTGQQIVGTVKSMQNSSTGVHAMIMLLKSKSGTITAGYSGGLVPYGVVSSDNAGNFSLPSLPRDSSGTSWYFLQAIPYDGYIPSYYAYNDSLQNKILWENAKLFQLSPDGGNPYEADVTVPPLAVGSGTISGTITEPTDSGLQPSARTFVYAIDQSAQSASAFDVTGYAVTDTKGNFTMGNLPIGSYALIADKTGFQYGLMQTISLYPDSSVVSNANFSLGSIRTGLRDENGTRPGSYVLSQNYPDPFTGMTTIQVTVPDGIRVGGLTLGVFDMLGRQVADLSSQLHISLQGNTGIVRFAPRDLPSGVYIYRLQDGSGYRETKHMLLVR